jgi:outer membrane receptor protein involved in Fe transport
VRLVLRLLVACAGLALAGAALAATVVGTVVERGTRSPLAGAEVVLRTAVDSVVVAHATTGADGGFRLERVRAGRFLFRASLLGHVPLFRSDVTISGDSTQVDLGPVELVVSPIALRGVETSTGRSTAIVASDRNIYLTKDMPAASAGNATDLLRSVPELEVDINDRVSLRGSSSVTIQINGRPSPLKGEALTAFLRQFAASRIERVEVIANPSAKFDPEGMAGIVNIVTKEPLDLGFSGSTFVTLGDRGQGGGPRVAWQQGRLTLSGGASGFWNQLEYSYDDSRTNLLASPPTSYRLSSRTKNRSGFGNFDGSFDFAFDKRSTLYGTTSGYVSRSRSDAVSGNVLSDANGSTTSSFDRSTDGFWDWRSGNGTLGFQHVKEKSRNEWTLELRANGTTTENASDVLQRFTAPTDSIGDITALDGDDDSREWSGQIDVTQPLGKKGKLEAGIRGLERRSTSLSTLAILSGSGTDGLSHYEHLEDFQTGYLTAGSTFGPFSLQLGVRGEAARTSFESIPRGRTWENDYRSVFPSANAAWDFGKGRTLRATYSKRIERPSTWYLNPDALNPDPLNRTVGNPDLKPKYTNSYGIEASWAGSRGLLRLSPFYRETLRNWDQFKSVDANGVAMTTWLNAAAVRSVGASLMGSWRQTGRIGGTFNMSVYRERHDASNLTQREQQDATLWSVGGNGTYKLTSKVDLQGWVRYNPAQTLAQGRQSGNLYMNIGARTKLGEKAWIALFINDPFKLWKYEFVSRDASFVQSSVNRGTIRRSALSFGWSWGKPPETKARRPAEEAPSQEPQPGPVR